MISKTELRQSNEIYSNHFCDQRNILRRMYGVFFHATDVIMFRCDDDEITLCVCAKIHLSIELNFVVDSV